MKRTMLFFVLCSALLIACEPINSGEGIKPVVSADDYYWYKGEKILLERGDQEYIIYDDSLLSKADKEKLVESENISYPGKSNLKWGMTKPNAVINDLEHVLYRMPSYKGDESGNVFVTHRFYVKLKDINDLSVLQNMAKQYDVEIEKEGTLPGWYTLRCNLPSSSNAMNLANIFYESGLFSVAEPEFIANVRFDI